ncbi:hypothetical protein ACLOJK_040905 [Asimina triloba]
MQNFGPVVCCRSKWEERVEFYVAGFNAVISDLGVISLLPKYNCWPPELIWVAMRWALPLMRRGGGGERRSEARDDGRRRRTTLCWWWVTDSPCWWAAVAVTMEEDEGTAAVRCSAGVGEGVDGYGLVGYGMLGLLPSFWTTPISHRRRRRRGWWNRIQRVVPVILGSSDQPLASSPELLSLAAMAAGLEDDDGAPYWCSGGAS